MSLLTDDEMRLIAGPRVDYFDHAVFGRAIEAKILAKLASAELPEPALTKQYNLHKAVRYMDKNSIGDCDASWVDAGVYFTADQLRQAYAQGAASQLSAEPVAKQFQTVDGGWHSFLDLQHEEHTIADGHWPIRELFTLKEPK